MIFYSSVQLILVAAAVIPAVALMIYVYKADKLEKEPTVLLWRLILQGIISTALAVFTERIGAQVLSRMVNPRSLLYQILFYFLVVGLSEEGFKFLLLKRRTWDSPYFNCRFDGIVYAVFVSMGFALWENIDYVVMYGLETAFVRALTAVPGHACFGVFMGAWYGLAKSHERHGHPEYCRTSLILSVVCPVLLHGLYDLIATLDNGSLSLVFIGFIAVMFVAAYRTVKKMSAQDRYF
ncbi:MAG: PrsW family intramembrane metalloprotease [Clostridia bacterium]|nr:PrsW family intramembrane metalloprotease [Clostridia bacterium]MBR0408176.1 PrsW family intramembrane metalloprotease [Clostridia bacterium]